MDMDILRMYAIWMDSPSYDIWLYYGTSITGNGYYVVYLITTASLEKMVPVNSLDSQSMMIQLQ